MDAPRDAEQGGPGAAWYAAGLRFTCRRCGNCCIGKGRYVQVSEAEIRAMAAAAGVAPEDFRDRHTQEMYGRTVLRDRQGGDCEWLERHADATTSCRVNDAKPEQCRTYPFWPRILRSPRTWETEGVRCHGIGDGDVVASDEIRRLAGVDRALDDLETLLDDLDAEVGELGATCWLRGDCCDFPTAGHRLFASALEARRFADAVDLTGWDPATGLCPAWKDRRCTAREHRPVGCRVYYCDPVFEERVHELMERYVTRLKWLHRKHAVPWDYRDWIAHLAALRETAVPGGDEGPTGKRATG